MWQDFCLKSNVTFTLHQCLIADMGLSSAELDVSVSLLPCFCPAIPSKVPSLAKRYVANACYNAVSRTEWVMQKHGSHLYYEQSLKKGPDWDGHGCMWTSIGCMLLLTTSHAAHNVSCCSQLLMHKCYWDPWVAFDNPIHMTSTYTCLHNSAWCHTWCTQSTIAKFSKSTSCISSNHTNHNFPPYGMSFDTTVHSDMWLHHREIQHTVQDCLDVSIYHMQGYMIQYNAWIYDTVTTDWRHTWLLSFFEWVQLNILLHQWYALLRGWIIWNHRVN